MRRTIPATPFLSRNLAEASRNFPEMMLALAVLDLPFEAPKHESKFDDTQMTLVPGGPLVVFHEEIQPADRARRRRDNCWSARISSSTATASARSNGEKVDKFVTDEFLIHTVYGCQVVITNPTSTRQKLNVLLQIPRGAIPVLNGKPTSTLHIDLEPYHTQTVEYHFYFPPAGQFPHFPVHVAKNEQLVAAAEPCDAERRRPPHEHRHASRGTTFPSTARSTMSSTFLDKHNIDELNLERIAWRMHDRSCL